MFKVMLRPKWIGALVLVLVMATVFVWLSAWQISRAEENKEVAGDDFETVISLTENQRPQMPPRDEAAGHRVTVTGTLIDDLPVIIRDRGFTPLSTANPTDEEREETGQSGFWVTTRMQTDEQQPAELMVVLGWAPTLDEALTAWNALEYGDVDLTGRFFPVEAPEKLDRIMPITTEDGTEGYTLTRVSPAAAINLWNGPLEPLRYNGYLINEADTKGLTTITTVAPEIDVELNLMNVFYAIEWIFFAGFAGYIWYRLVRDEWQAEQDALQETIG